MVEIFKTMKFEKIQQGEGYQKRGENNVDKKFN